MIAIVLCHDCNLYVCAELKDLINELQEVTDWYLLGLCLGLSESRLQEIKQDHRTNDEWRREVLATWARQEKPTWSKVVSALMEMGGHQVLASQIAEIYGNFVKYITACMLSFQSCISLGYTVLQL